VVEKLCALGKSNRTIDSRPESHAKFAGLA
jgi:hypothetical protein